MTATLLGVITAVVAGVVGVWATRWLAAGGHRYTDEADRPPRRHRWLAPTVAVVAGLVAWGHAERPALGLVLAASVVFLGVLVAIDLDVHRLPDAFTKPAWLVTPAALGVVALLEHDGSAWLRAVLTGVALAAGYWLLVRLGEALAPPGEAGGLGRGDLKLSPTLGMLLGYQSVGHALLATVLTFLLGGIAAAGLLLLRGRAARRARIAFGPWLAAGAALVWLLPTLRLLP